MTESAHRQRADGPAAAERPRPSAGNADLRLAAVGRTAAEVPDPGRLLLVVHSVEPPLELLAEFAAGVRASWRASPDKTAAEQIWDMFESEYLIREPVSALLVRCITWRADVNRADPWIALFNIRQSIGAGQENPALAVSGFLTAMGLEVSVLSRHSQVLASGLTIAYVKCLAGLPAWGVGIGGDLTAASLKAVLSAVNRAGCGRRRVAGSDQGKRLTSPEFPITKPKEDLVP